mmetsp:Transcript_41726/g.105198  ORF Transcript_41726/g.105198 Transcript_41726/m.105198 type:complete len:427 (-) Transcript_41726:146-1426(-)
MWRTHHHHRHLLLLLLLLHLLLLFQCTQTGDAASAVRGDSSQPRVSLALKKSLSIGRSQIASPVKEALSARDHSPAAAAHASGTNRTRSVASQHGLNDAEPPRRGVRFVHAELDGKIYTFEVPLECRGAEVAVKTIPRFSTAPRNDPKKTAVLNIALLVDSPGGVGSSHLLGALSMENHFDTNSRVDADHLKHLPRPPKVSSLYSHLELNNGAASSAAHRVPFRALYVFDQPIPAVASHFRRGWWRGQAGKLNGGTCPVPNLGRKPPQRGSQPEVVSHPSNLTQPEFDRLFKLRQRERMLEEYAHLGRDYFRLEENMHRWLLEETTYDRILVHGAYQDHLVEPLLQLLRMERLPARLPVWKKELLQPHMHQAPSISSKAMKELQAIYRQSSQLVDRMPLLSIRYGTESTPPDPDSDFHLQNFPGTE